MDSARQHGLVSAIGTGSRDEHVRRRCQLSGKHNGASSYRTPSGTHCQILSECPTEVLRSSGRGHITAFSLGIEGRR